MGRGPRRPRFRFREEPRGASTRAFVREEETDPINVRDEQGHPIRTLEESARVAGRSRPPRRLVPDSAPCHATKNDGVRGPLPDEGLSARPRIPAWRPTRSRPLRLAWCHMGRPWNSRNPELGLGWRTWLEGLPDRRLHPRDWKCRAPAGNDGGVGISATITEGLARPLRGACSAWVRAPNDHPARHALEVVDVMPVGVALVWSTTTDRLLELHTGSRPDSWRERPITTGRAPAVAAWR
jgi:hypothetical protein